MNVALPTTALNLEKYCLQLIACLQMPPGKLNQRCLISAFSEAINPLAPNDIYIYRTAELTSRRCILNIYSTNILTEYFKHAAHCPGFSLQDAVYFIMLSFLVPVIFTF